jgi:hypothetical protein
MAFKQGEEAGQITKDVDEFLRSTLERNKAIGAQLSMVLGSFMLPGAMGVKGGGPRNRPSMNFLRYVAKELKPGGLVSRSQKPSIHPQEVANTIPFSRARPKGYTRAESGNLSELTRAPSPKRGTSGQGEGYGTLRRSAEYTATPKKMPSDPYDYIVKRASEHFNKLTPAEKYRVATYSRPELGFDTWDDLFDIWQMRFDTGQKDKLPADIYNAFRAMAKGEEAAAKGTSKVTRNFVREAVEGDPKRSMTQQALDLGKDLFKGRVDRKELESAHKTFKSMWKDNPDLVMRNQYFTEAFEFADILGGARTTPEGRSLDTKIEMFKKAGDLPKDF